MSHEISVEDKEREAKWQAESDLRTLREADDIKGDKGRMTAANKILSEEMTAMGKLKGKLNFNNSPSMKK